MDWRDRALDKIADDYEHAGEQAKADRLRHFLQGARAIAAENGRLDTPGRPPQIEAWVTERLPELSRGRSATLIGPYWRRWRTLTAEFRRVRAADARTGQERPAPDWRPIIEHHETMLTRVMTDEGKPINLARRRLELAERLEVIASRRGVVREPHIMAMRLLWLACRPRDEELKDSSPLR